MRDRRRPFRYGQGMTLIELLVVIAVLAIISGILLSGVFTLSRNSDRVYCIAALKEIGSALKQYRTENRAYPPPLRVEEYGYYNAATGETLPWNAPAPGPGWSPPSAHEGPALAYYSQLPSTVDLTAFKCAGAVASLVGHGFLKRAPVCRRDPSLKAAELSDYSTYSTYSTFYNYWGYDGPYWDWNGVFRNDIQPSGRSYRYWWPDNDPTAAVETDAPLEARGDHLPYGIPSWDSYPRLLNANAPDVTIVTRCPNHDRRFNEAEKGKAYFRSNVLRLGGDVTSVWDDEWLADDDGVPGDPQRIPYQYQPQAPGRP